MGIVILNSIEIVFRVAGATRTDVDDVFATPGIEIIVVACGLRSGRRELLPAVIRWGHVGLTAGWLYGLEP